MSSATEIASAIRELTPNERAELFLQLAEIVRKEGMPLPPPRDFTLSEMKKWIEEDERDMRDFREGR